MNLDTSPIDDEVPARLTREHTRFVGSVPEHYDRCLGPFLFDPYARDLARRVRVPAASTVLEIACGTGIFTRQLREELPDSVAIVATDLNEAMLDHARPRCIDLPNVRFEQADAQNLPYDDRSFDAVVCQFGLMFLSDKLLGMRESLRVLRPGAALTSNTWRSVLCNPIVATVRDTLAQILGGEPPTFFDVPFGYHDEDRIAADLTAAGFDAPAFETVRANAESASARLLATGFVEGTPAISEIRDRASVASDEVVDTLARELRAAYGDAPLRAPLEAVAIAARRPLL